MRNSLANCLFSETTSELIPVPLFVFYKSIHKRSSLENYTSNNTTQHETTRHNTRQHEYNTTQYETTQLQHETTRVQHEYKTT